MPCAAHASGGGVRDEPTGALDTANSELVLQVLRELADAGSSVVMVTHDTDAAALEAFAKKPTYKILQQDRNAHIVRSPAERSYFLRLV